MVRGYKRLRIAALTLFTLNRQPTSLKLQDVNIEWHVCLMWCSKSSRATLTISHLLGQDRGKRGHDDVCEFIVSATNCRPQWRQGINLFGHSVTCNGEIVCNNQTVSIDKLLKSRTLCFANIRLGILTPHLASQWIGSTGQVLLCSSPATSPFISPLQCSHLITRSIQVYLTWSSIRILAIWAPQWLVQGSASYLHVCKCPCWC